MAKAKGSEKTGGATRGSVHQKTLEVKDQVLNHWAKVNADGKYVEKLSKENPSKYLDLVAKILPSTQEHDVSVTHVDLGAAMIDAQARLNAIEHNPMDSVGPSIDKPTLSEPLPLSPDEEVTAPPPPRPYLLDEKFDLQIDAHGLPIKGDG
jgi:hypothetical protein